MNVLKEIAGVLEKNKVDFEQLPEITASETNSGKQRSSFDLYQAIITGKVNTDEEAAIFLDYPKGHVGYRKIKSALKKRMLNVLLSQSINDSSLNQRQKAYFECYKYWSAAKILLGKSAREAAISLSRSILVLARRFEFIDLALDVTRTLRLHFGTIERNVKEYNRFDELFQQYFQIYEWEQMAEGLYADLSISYKQSGETGVELSQKASAHFEKLSPYLNQTDAYRVLLCGMLIELMIYSSVNDYEPMMKVCWKYIDRFKEKKYIAAVPIQIAYYHLMVGSTQLCLYREGEKVAKECMAFIDPGSFNWFKYQELYFVLSMHTGHYQNALTVFLSVRQNRKLEFQNQIIQETWRIFEAYLFFLIKAGELEAPDDRYWNKKFRLQNF